MKLANRLRKLRKENGLTIREVADPIQVPISTYRDWEYGKGIRGEPYQKLAKLFNISLEMLMSGEEKPVSAPLEHLLRVKESIDFAIKSVRAL